MSHAHHRRSLRQHLADLHGQGKNHSHRSDDNESHGIATVPDLGTATTLTPPMACRAGIAPIRVRALGGCCSSCA
jgi:hypothetical protein